jgi:hypothetical protein
MITQPLNWPANAPAYHSKAGWEFEKKAVEQSLRKPRLTYTCLIHMRTSCVWAIDWAIAYDLTDEYLRYCRILDRIEKSMWGYPSINTLIKIN